MKNSKVKPFDGWRALSIKRDNPATKLARKLGFTPSETFALWWFGECPKWITEAGSQSEQKQLLELIAKRPEDCLKVIKKAKERSRTGRLRNFILRRHLIDESVIDDLCLWNAPDAEIADAYCKEYGLKLKGKTLLGLLKQIKTTRAQLRRQFPPR